MRLVVVAWKVEENGCKHRDKEYTHADDRSNDIAPDHRVLAQRQMFSLRFEASLWPLQEMRESRAGIVMGVQGHSELGTQYTNDEVSAGIEERVFLHQPYKALRNEAHGQYADEHPHPDEDDIAGVGVSGDNIVDREGEVHDLYEDDGSPEMPEEAKRFTIKPGAFFLPEFFLYRLVGSGLFGEQEIFQCKAQQVDAAHRLEPPDLNKQGGEEQADTAEHIGADDTVTEGLAAPRKAGSR